jgi:hypothetical protein
MSLMAGSSTTSHGRFFDRHTAGAHPSVPQRIRLLLGK